MAARAVPVAPPGRSKGWDGRYPPPKPPDDAFAGTLRDVYVADVRTDQIGKPEQRRECGEVAYDQRKLVLFHHC